MAHSDSLYWALILTDKAYMETLLKDGDRYDGLLRQPILGFILTARAYTETLLRDGSPLDGLFRQPISGPHLMVKAYTNSFER